MELSLVSAKRYGFNSTAVSKSCEILDISPAFHKVITEFDIVEHLLKNIYDGIYKSIESNLDFSESIIQLSVNQYIDRIGQYNNHWSEAMAVLSNPSNIRKSNTLLFDFSSNLIFKSGDRSLDFEWYAKRKQLSLLIILSELYLLTDRSPNFYKTKNFFGENLALSKDTNSLFSNINFLLLGVNNGLYYTIDNLKNLINSNEFN